MDFIILKVNGKDLRDASHEQAIEAFRDAQEPIVVEVARRDWKTRSSENDPPPSFNNLLPGAKPEMIAEGTAPDLASCDMSSVPDIPSRVLVSSETVYSSSASGLLDIAELAVQDECEDDDEDVFNPEGLAQNASNGFSFKCNAKLHMPDETQFVDFGKLEFKEVKLLRSNEDESFGLTLCYREIETCSNRCEIYVGEIKPNSPAARCTDLQLGDRIVQINRELVSSRSRVFDLFKLAPNSIDLLIARQSSLGDELRKCSSNEEGDFNRFERPEHDSGLGRTTDESVRTEESSEQDLDTEIKTLNHEMTPHSTTTSPENKLLNRTHPLDQIDAELLKVGHLMQSLALHCRQLVDAKMNYRLDGERPGLTEKSEEIPIECSESQRRSGYYGADYRSVATGKLVAAETEGLKQDSSASEQTSAYCTGESMKNQGPRGQVHLRLWHQNDRTNVEDCLQFSDVGGSYMSLSTNIPTLGHEQKPVAYRNNADKTCFSPISNWSIDESLDPASRISEPPANGTPSKSSNVVSVESCRDGVNSVRGASESGSECFNRSRPSGISNNSSSDSLNIRDRVRFRSKEYVASVVPKTSVSATQDSAILNGNENPVKTIHAGSRRNRKSGSCSRDRIRLKNNSQKVSSGVSPKDKATGHEIQNPMPVSVPTISLVQANDGQSRIPTSGTFPKLEHLVNQHHYELYDHVFPTHASPTQARLPESRPCEMNPQPPQNLDTSDIYETPYASVTLDEIFDAPAKQGQPAHQTLLPYYIDQLTPSSISVTISNLIGSEDPFAALCKTAVNPLRQRSDPNSPLRGEYDINVENGRTCHVTGIANSASFIDSKPFDDVMEWVVKKRPDGSRYITRRPIRHRLIRGRVKCTPEKPSVCEKPVTFNNNHLDSRPERRKHGERNRPGVRMKHSQSRPATQVPNSKTQFGKEPRLGLDQFEATAV